MAAKNRRMFELRLGKLGLALFVGGMSLLLCSMFVLGIVVGKQMEAYPERFSTGVAELIRDRLFSTPPQAARTSSSLEVAKRDVPAGGEESVPVDVPGGKKEGAVSGKAADALKVDPEASVPEAVPAGKTAIPGAPLGPAAGAGSLAAPPAATGAVKPNRLPEKKTVESGAGLQAPVKADAAANSQPSPGEGSFEIQVAAYQDRPKAEQAVDKLKPLGYLPRIVQKDLPGKGVWFRVIVGGFESREKAQVAADLIAGKVRGVKCVIRPSRKNGGG